jgi:hypothetical protein
MVDCRAQAEQFVWKMEIYPTNCLRSEQEIASVTNKHFDEKQGPIGHWVAGKSFGASATHEIKRSIHPTFGQKAIQLWKCGYIFFITIPLFHFLACALNGAIRVTCSH